MRGITTAEEATARESDAALDDLTVSSLSDCDSEYESSKKNTTTFSQPNTHSAGKSGTTGN
jgi:hypothetical protein